MEDPVQLRKVDGLFEDGNIPNGKDFMNAVGVMAYAPRISYLPRLIQQEKKGNSTVRLDKLFELCEDLLKGHTDDDGADGQQENQEDAANVLMTESVDQDYVELFSSSTSYSNRYDGLQCGLVGLACFGDRGMELICEGFSSISQRMQKLMIKILVSSTKVVSNEVLTKMMLELTLGVQKIAIYQLCRYATDRAPVLDALHQKICAKDVGLANSFLHACTKEYVAKTVHEFVEGLISSSHHMWGIDFSIRVPIGRKLRWDRLCKFHMDVILAEYRSNLEAQQGFILRYRVIHSMWGDLLAHSKVNKFGMGEIFKLHMEFPPYMVTAQGSRAIALYRRQEAKQQILPDVPPGKEFAIDAPFCFDITIRDTAQLASMMYKTAETHVLVGMLENHCCDPIWKDRLEGVVDELSARLCGDRPSDRQQHRRNYHFKDDPTGDVKAKAQVLSFCVGFLSSQFSKMHPSVSSVHSKFGTLGKVTFSMTREEYVKIDRWEAKKVDRTLIILNSCAVWCGKLIEAGVSGKETPLTGAILQVMEELFNVCKTVPDLKPKVVRLLVNFVFENVLGLVRDRRVKERHADLQRGFDLMMDLYNWTSSMPCSTRENAIKIEDSEFYELNELLKYFHDTALVDKKKFAEMQQRLLKSYTAHYRKFLEYMLEPENREESELTRTSRSNLLQQLTQLLGQSKHEPFVCELVLEELDYIASRYLACCGDPVQGSHFISVSQKGSKHGKEFVWDENSKSMKRVRFPGSFCCRLQTEIIDILLEIFKMLQPKGWTRYQGETKVKQALNYRDFDPEVSRALQKRAWDILSATVFLDRGEDAIHTYTLVHVDGECKTGNIANILYLFVVLREFVPIDRLCGRAVEDLFIRALITQKFLGKLLQGQLSVTISLEEYPCRLSAPSNFVGNPAKKYRELDEMGNPVIDWLDRVWYRCLRSVEESGIASCYDLCEPELMRASSILDPLVATYLEEACRQDNFTARKANLSTLFQAALGQRVPYQIVRAFRCLNRFSKNEQATNRVEYLTEFSRVWPDIIDFFLFGNGQNRILGDLGDCLEFLPPKKKSTNDDGETDQETEGNYNEKKGAATPSQAPPTGIVAPKDFGNEVLKLWQQMIKQSISAINMDASSYSSMCKMLEATVQTVQENCFLRLRSSASQHDLTTALVWYKAACRCQFELVNLRGSKVLDEIVLKHIPSIAANPSAVEDMESLRGKLETVLMEAKVLPESILNTAAKYLRQEAEIWRSQAVDMDVYEANPSDFVKLVQAGYEEIGIPDPFVPNVDENGFLPRNSAFVARLQGWVKAFRSTWLLIPKMRENLVALGNSLEKPNVPAHHIAQVSNIYDILFWASKPYGHGIPSLRRLLCKLVKSLESVKASVDSEKMGQYISNNRMIMNKYFEMGVVNSSMVKVGEMLENATEEGNYSFFPCLLWKSLKASTNFPLDRWEDVVERKCTLALEALTLCKSAIHFPFVSNVLKNYRQDLFDQFVVLEDPHETFDGLFHMNDDEKDFVKLNFTEVEIEEARAKRVGYRITNANPTAHSIPYSVNIKYSKQLYQDANNDLLEFKKRKQMLAKWLVNPSMKSSEVVGRLSDLYEQSKEELETSGSLTVETQTFIATFIDKIFAGDDPRKSLAFLLSPQVIKGDVNNVTARVIDRAKNLLPEDTLVETLRLALSNERRLALKVGLHRSVVQMLSSIITPKSMHILKEEFLRTDLHQDVRAEIFNQAKGFLAGATKINFVAQFAFDILQTALNYLEQGALDGKDLQNLRLLLAQTCLIDRSSTSRARGVVAEVERAVLHDHRSDPLVTAGLSSKDAELVNNAPLGSPFTIDVYLEFQFCKEFLWKLVETKSDSLLQLIAISSCARSWVDLIPGTDDWIGILEELRACSKTETMESILEWKAQPDVWKHTIAAVVRAIVWNAYVAFVLFKENGGMEKVAQVVKNDIHTLVYEPPLNVTKRMIATISLTHVSGMLQRIRHSLSQRYPAENAEFCHAVLFESIDSLKVLDTISGQDTSLGDIGANELVDLATNGKRSKKSF